jgi:NADH-quinone oxidoreductase subunit G
MPCTAKKREILHKKSKGDTAFVLSSSEIISMIRDACIDYIALSGDDSDECKWGRASGAGMLFDVTGGFTEAVLRCMFSVFGRNTQENYQYIAESGIRGLPKPDPKSGTLSNGIKTVVFNLGEVEFSVAVVSGLANADTLIKRIKNGEHFDFVEVTACPGGCICGGGQPKAEWFVKEKRKDALYLSDSMCQVKSAEQNPDIRLWFDLMNSKSLEHKYWHRTHSPHSGF